MRRLGLALLALGLASAPAFAQNQGQLGQLQAEIGPSGGLKVECVGAGCGGVATGPSVDIVSVAGVPIVGGDVPVKFSVPQHVIIDSMPAGGAGLTDAELRATPVPVSVSGVSTAARQDTGNTSLSSIDGKLTSLGQKAVTGSVPVTLPSDALPPPDRKTSGTITTTVPNQQLLVTYGSGTTLVTLSGVWTGTLTFTGYDGFDTTAIKAVNLSTGALESTATANGAWIVPSAGHAAIFVNGPTASGTATVRLMAGIGSNIVSLGQPLPAGTNVIGHTIVDSGAVTTTLAAETTKVIGTVNQGTSPWTVNLITGFALAATQTDRTQKTQLTDGTRDGTVKAASTLPLLTDTAIVTTQRDPLPAGTNVLGALTANQSVNVAQMGGVATAMNTGVRTAGVQRVTIATDDIVPASQSGTWTVQPGNTANTTAWLVNGPALTKGTQGAAGYTIQELKDAGRTLVTLTAERVVPVLTTDTIVTCAKLVGDTATAGVTTYAVTSGKTLRLQAIHISLTPSSTTLGVVQVRLRTLSSGACTVAAGLKVAQWEIGNPGTGTQVANAANQRLDAFFPDGVEFSGATRNICLSMNALAAAAQVVTISLVGYEY